MKQGRRPKTITDYFVKATDAHVSHQEYLRSPANSFLQHTKEAKDAIEKCRNDFKKNSKDNLNSDGCDSLQYIVLATLPLIMGHFETYQKYLFAGLFDMSIYLKEFSPKEFFDQLKKGKNIELKIEDIALYRDDGIDSMGLLLVHSLGDWHNPITVNHYFNAFNIFNNLFSSKQIELLQILWQLRHSIVHNGGTLTLADAQKIPELKKYGGRQIAFEDLFIRELCRRFHTVISDVNTRLENKFRKSLMDNLREDANQRISRFFGLPDANKSLLNN